jgi:hypothetical protein
MIGDPEECRKRAAECRELAANTTGPIARDAYLHLAGKWDELADEIIRTKHVLMAINMAGIPPVLSAANRRREKPS